jgi:ornithine lipid hydroxylase
MVASAVRIALFPTVFTAALIGGHAAWAAGLGEGMTLLLVTAVVVCIIGASERLWPYEPEWNVARGDVVADVLHNLVSMIALPRALHALLMASLMMIALRLEEALGASLWPIDWPWPAQLALAMVGSQFFEYWWHRCCHEAPILWRYHAIHHSPERLYWLNAGRFHPLDAAFSYLAGVLFLVLLGAPEQVVMLQTLWVAVHGLFQHCNVDVRLGPLNYIFSMAELHRWHHSKTLEEANHNYGNNIIFWDLVFGTFYWPRERRPSADIGLSDISGFPRGYLGQLLAPFRWGRLEGPGVTAREERAPGPDV